MNKFFINIAKSLKLKEDLGSPPVTLNDILEKFIFHPSIDKITKTYESDKKFSFQQGTEEHVRQVILSIDGSKVTSVGDIPADMLKVALDIHLPLITKFINLLFENGCFPDDLKTFIFNNFIFNNSNEEKILGITIDYKLTFKGHIEILSGEAAQKMGALSRQLNHLSDSQKISIFNSLIKSQFNYCPLIWMFCSRISNNMINKIHERALRLILNDHTSDFDTLLQNNNDTCNHHRNIQTLMIEIYKMKNNLNPPIMDNMLERRNNTYNLRNFHELATKRKRTVKMGLETLNYRSPQLWSILPENLRQMNSLV